MHLHSFAWKLNFARAAVAVPGVMWTLESAASARVWIILFNTFTVAQNTQSARRTTVL